ncbi:MAG: GNAT family N-acetyltransferase [Flavobacteriaceae bacterium]|nr:GNAT family N-acetyltransferase [Flavobacteriaceae bacterium]
MYSVKKYTKNNSSEWNAFLNTAKNATFLFHRDFMDYHQDRFDDFSLMIYKKNKLIAVLPANKVEDKIFSHQGLTYGGLILRKDLNFKDILEGFKNCMELLVTNGLKELYLSLIPDIYKTYPSNEIDYLLFKLEANLYRRDTSSSIFYNEPLKIQSNRLQGKKKAEKLQLEIKEESTFNAFWNEILIPNLDKTYGSEPVHSLDEISLLKKSFPKNIRQFNVYQNNNLVAGATIFDIKTVAHVQYISANEDKQKLGSLDFLFEHLINVTFKHKVYFDFGTSNKNQGQQINEGLLYWKEGFGARTITQDFYCVDLNNKHKLDTILK